MKTIKYLHFGLFLSRSYVVWARPSRTGLTQRRSRERSRSSFVGASKSAGSVHWWWKTLVHYKTYIKYVAAHAVCQFNAYLLYVDAARLRGLRQQNWYTYLPTRTPHLLSFRFAPRVYSAQVYFCRRNSHHLSKKMQVPNFLSKKNHKKFFRIDKPNIVITVLIHVYNRRIFRDEIYTLRACVPANLSELPTAAGVS